MLYGEVVESGRVGSQVFAVDTSGHSWNGKIEKRLLAFYSKSIDKLGLYSYGEKNLLGARILFFKNFKRHYKLIKGNYPFRFAKSGLYDDIIYLDFKSFYAKVFLQIANHIDESYYGKPRKGIAEKNQFIKSFSYSSPHISLSKKALKAPLVDINDIAQNSIAIDKNDKSEALELVNKMLSVADYEDEVDKGVAKIHRNAFVFGFGYETKFARINNISALVMFFARKIIERTAKELSKSHEVVFSHTDSLLMDYDVSIKELDMVLKETCDVLNELYFKGVEILHFTAGDLGIKDKFEQIRILNPNVYFAVKKDAKSRLVPKIMMAGFATDNTNGIAKTKEGRTLREVMSEIQDDILNLRIENLRKYYNQEFLYDLIYYRTAEEYTKKLEDAWYSGDYEFLSKRATSVRRTIGELVDLCVTDAVKL